MGSKGFTLIELLISITIIAVILVIVMGAFRIGIKAWEKGEADIETYQRQQIVLQLVKQQIASMRKAEMRPEDMEPYYFKGNEHTLEFLSDISVVPKNSYGLVFVKYRIRESEENEKLMLEIHEAGLSKKSASAAVFEPRDDAYYSLIDNMDVIEFEYLLKKDDEMSWEPVWAPEDIRAEMPAALRLTFRAAENKPAVSMVARIHAGSIDT